MRLTSAARSLAHFFSSASLSLALFTHRHLFCFIWLSNQKEEEEEEYKTENKNVRKLRTSLLKHTHIHVKYKKRARMTVIFKKKGGEGKKEICSLFSCFVRVNEWWLKFFHRCIFYTLAFSHLINDIKWMSTHSVLFKKVHTRASRESSFSSSNIKSCSLWVRTRRN